MTTPVNFNTAKLLEKKDIIIETSTVYSEHDKTRVYDESDIREGLIIKAPTIAEVVTWIYEKHGIWLFPEWQFSRKMWLYTIQDIASYDNTIKIQEQNYKDVGEVEFNSPTKAYEAAIEYYLTELI